MSRIGRDLARAADDLRAAGGRFALVGGLAVSARAAPRFTRDVDLAVAVDDDDAAAAVVARLRPLGYAVLAAVEQDAVGRLATVRLVHAGRAGRADADEQTAGNVVDLLFASSGVEPELVDAAEELEVVDGTRVPVATTGHLMALKLLARDDRGRPQDADDLRALLAVATPVDLTTARTAVGLIAARGFARGRDLPADLEALLRQDR